jgi:hypothetical protein
MKKSLTRVAIQLALITMALLLTPSQLFGQMATSSEFKEAPVETASVELTPSLADGLRPGADGRAVFAALPMAPMPAPAAMAPMAFITTTTRTKNSPPHAFWDRENKVLFTAVAGLATADFIATHANLASGGKELNPATRVLAGSTPGLVTNFALETGAVMGLSYMFHRTGHHKLERITALVDIGTSGAAAGFSFAHR